MHEQEEWAIRYRARAMELRRLIAFAPEARQKLEDLARQYEQMARLRLSNCRVRVGANHQPTTAQY